MSEHLLDGAEVSADFVHGDRERSAEVVEPELAVDSGFRFEGGPRGAERGARDWPAALQRVVGGLWISLGDSVEGLLEFLGERYGDRPSGFFLGDGQRLAVAGAVLWRGAHGVASAEARVRAEQDDCPHPRLRGGAQRADFFRSGDDRAGPWLSNWLGDWETRETAESGEEHDAVVERALLDAALPLRLEGFEVHGRELGGCELAGELDQVCGRFSPDELVGRGPRFGERADRGARAGAFFAAASARIFSVSRVACFLVLQAFMWRRP